MLPRVTPWAEAQHGAMSAPIEAELGLEGEGGEGQHGHGVAGRDDGEVAAVLDGLLQVHGHRVAVLHDLGVPGAPQAQELVVLRHDLRGALGEVEREVDLVSAPAQHGRNPQLLTPGEAVPGHHYSNLALKS